MSVEVDEDGSFTIFVEKRFSSDDGYRVSATLGTTRVWVNGHRLGVALGTLGSVLDKVEESLGVCAERDIDAP